MNKIKMVDLSSQYSRIKTEIDDAIQSVIKSSAFIQGPEVSLFAEDLSRYLDTPHVITCGNGTDALQIAMMALDLKAGDEVILPVHTYVATAEVIALLKLKPVFIDVFPDTFNIDVTQLERTITSRTRAIVPVHLYGQCAHMQPILEIAQKHNLFVIEDAAQALSAEYTFKDGVKRHAGTIGHIGTTSFFPSKNLGCFGDGGAMFTSDPVLAKKLKMIANHGQEKKYHHEIIGVNSRLDTLQAAILRVKLKYLEEYTRKRNEVASYYDGNLAGIENLIIPFRSSFSSHGFHQYTVRIRRGRDEIKRYLESEGIPTMVYYPVPLHFQNAYKRPEFGEGSFPITEELSKQVLSLPIHTEMKEEELQFICDTLKRYSHG